MPNALPLLLASALAGKPDERGCDFSDARVLEALNDGVEAYNIRDLPVARRLLAKVLKAQPDCLKALDLAGRVAVLEGRAEEADAIGRGLALYPDWPSFPGLAANMMFAAQEFERSLEMARLAISLAPGTVTPIQLEQMALLRLGRYSEATAALNAAEGLHPGTLDCFRVDIFRDQGQVADAVLLKPSCQSSPDDGIRAFSLGNLAAVQGGEGSEQTDLNPTQTAALRAFREERYADAERLFAEQLEKESWNVWAKIFRASCLVVLGRDAEATDLMQEMFGAETWVTVHAGGQFSGVLTKGTELSLEKSIKSALALLVGVLVKHQRFEEAATALRKAEGRFGRVPELLGPRIDLETATSGAAAWATADAALSDHPERKDIAEAVGSLAFRYPAGLTPTNLAILAKVPASAARHNTLAGLYNSRRGADCLAFAVVAQEGIDAVSLAGFRSTAYDCAAVVGDLAALDSFYNPSNPTPSGWSLASHARLLQQGGRTAEAKRLAVRAMDMDGGGGMSAVVLGEIALAEGNLEEVVRLAADKRGEAGSCLSLAIALYNLERYDEARRASVGLNCRDYDGERGECEGFLKALKGAP